MEQYLTTVEPEIQELNLELLWQLNICTRDQDTSKIKLIAQATLNDPRFKKYGFGGNENAFRATYTSVVEKLNSGCVEENCTTYEVTPSSAPKTTLWDEFDEKVHQLAAVSE